MIRKTSQALAPLHHQPTPVGQYDIYPALSIGDHKIQVGMEALVDILIQHKRIIIDCYGGVVWDKFRVELMKALNAKRLNYGMYLMDAIYREESQINDLIAPFLGGDDPIFGTRFTGQLRDFFRPEGLADMQPDEEVDISIVYGCGAALVEWEDAFVVYVDVPKNEIQFRARAGSICNLGAKKPDDTKAMYKRFYFVDWVALNKHKAQLLPRIDLLVDDQRPDAPVFTSGDDFRAALQTMSENCFRVRPWFEPGVWGGQWIKQHIPQLPKDVPNYAWSFELIVPENGLMVESDGLLLEFSFDFLMFHNSKAIVGDAVQRFGTEFPIRFDFLDTFDGGNLSVQCHPRTSYIQKHFGETFTQDETYYILDCEPDAKVYLGFQDGVQPLDVRQALEDSFTHNTPLDVEQFVQVFPAHKHDLFLIPNGTIHCSGKNNLVLEISATPYIFTFKMYDWLRMDLDGKPRPLNIDRALENVRFDLQGERVREELLSKPTLKTQSDGWQCIHVPTHADHFYDVYRYEIAPHASVEITTNASCQVMSLVEGSTIVLETANGMVQQFNFAETFVVPAAAHSFRLTNDTDTVVKVINAFMKA